ncbi:hypothetical protein SUGI_0065010 [Cryptomeria japonica]|uniref:importin subunit alpha-1 n=1 Tax=Cryptomeria japonica TaxID=3369 RepID=UPI002408B70F|nr:importin subunit alpha-1 [Cryptomeria japonica]GLJ07353.1 hypothetical protein SUGI_0065010 [Cryptomeria japonica]
MAALRITDSTKQLSASRNGEELKEQEEEDEGNLDLYLYLSEKQELVTDDDDLQEVVYEVKYGEPIRQLPALRELRKIYSFQKDQINAELVPVLVDCLTRDDSTELQYEAAYMLRYLARNETAVLIENDAVPLFSNLLNSPSEDVQEQAVRAIATLAEQALLSFDCRAITEDIILNLLPFFYRPKSPFKIFWFALKSLVYIIRCKPIEDTSIALTILKELLETEEDTQVQRLACEALSSFSEGPEGVEFIIGNDICPCLVELLFHDSPHILLSVMETMANIAEHENYKEVINDRALSRIVAIVSNGDKRDSKTVRHLHMEICRLVASITRLTQEDIELTINSGVIYALVSLLAEAVDSVKEEAAVAIVNGITYGSEEQVVYFVDLDCINLLSYLIRPNNRSLAEICLDGIDRMLKFIKEENKHPHLFWNTELENLLRTQIQGISLGLVAEHHGLLCPPAKKPCIDLSRHPRERSFDENIQIERQSRF